MTVAFVAALITVPAAAQTPSADRLAAAHVMIDDAIAGGMRDSIPEMRASMPFDKVDEQERAVMQSAFDEGLPKMIVAAQDFVAAKAADRWSLDELTHPDNIPEADVSAVITALQQPLHDIGENFGLHVIKTGCNARPDPSDPCKAMLDFIAEYEASNAQATR